MVILFSDDEKIINIGRKKEYIPQFRDQKKYQQTMLVQQKLVCTR